MILNITPKVYAKRLQTNNNDKIPYVTTSVSFSGKMPVVNPLIEQFDKFLKANKLTLECAYEPAYQPKNKKYLIEPYYYANLSQNNQRVNRKGDAMSLFGFGKNSKEDAILNLIDKISGYKLYTENAEIEPFLPDGCKEKTLRTPLHFDVINS